MDERDKSEGERRLPAQQAQQPQPTTAANDHQIPGAQIHSISDISERSSKDQPASRREGGEPKSDVGAAGASFDDARFTAGVVKLYEALLKEPIPEEMLRLVDQLGKQERR